MVEITNLYKVKAIKIGRVDQPWNWVKFSVVADNMIQAIQKTRAHYPKDKYEISLTLKEEGCLI